MLQPMFNAGPLPRIWGGLRNADTGATLSLAPGEEAQVDVPAGFTDPYLKPVVQGAKKHPKEVAAPEPPVIPEPALSGETKEK